MNKSFVFFLVVCMPLVAFDATEIENKLFAVHVTKTFPDGTLKAGMGEKPPSPIPASLFPDCRCTLHFSLGEMVRPVEGVMSWEDCTFAVVTPLKDLLPQLVNLNCYDTFIVGNFALTPSSILILPQDTLITMIARPYKLCCYDPAKTTLREVIENVICDHGGWNVTMNSEDKEDELHEAYLDGVNINTTTFFSPITDKFPHVSVGCRYVPLNGGNAWQLGDLEVKLLSTTTCYFNADLPVPDLEALKNARDELIAKTKLVWSLYLPRTPLPKEALASARKKCAPLFAWLNLIDEDIRMRKLYHKTLKGAPNEVWEKIAKVCMVPLKLSTTLEKLMDQLPSDQPPINQKRFLLTKLRGGNYAHAGDEEAIDLVVDKALEIDGNLKNENVLDVGSGFGGTVDYLFKCGFQKVEGVDLDLASCQYATSLYPHLTFTLGDAENLKRIYPEKKFKLFTSFNVFYAIQEKQKALRELHAIAEPNAVLAIFDYTGKMEKMVDLAGRPMQPLSLETIESDLKKAGWQLIEVCDLSQEYMSWYQNLLVELENLRETISSSVSREVIDEVKETFQKMLYQLEEGTLGGALILAKKRVP